MNHSRGFTLIELVVVLVILGVLAAVAVPRFIDLSSEAEDAALQATAASLSSAFAINFAKSRVSDDSSEYTEVDNADCGALNDDEATIDALVNNFDHDRFDIESANGGATFTALRTNDEDPLDCQVVFASDD